MTRINLEQLRAFLWVVRTGGVRKAVNALNLSQPAISARIKKLEDSLSVELFARHSHGLRLSKKGETLLKYAEQLEHLLELVEKDVVNPSRIERNLRIGVSETIIQCWLPDFIAALHQRFPELLVEINVDISAHLRESLLNNQIDLAILLGPVSESSVNNVALHKVDLAWYRSTKLGSHYPVFSNAFTEAIITYPRNTRPFREIQAQLFETVGPGVRFFPSSSLSSCFRLVEAGLGIAALPRVLGRPFVAEGKIVEFSPGWLPSPLEFTASYLGNPKSFIIEESALIAKETALNWLQGPVGVVG